MIINSAKELGSLVRSERKRRGWSQRELAERVGVSPLWVSNFERGKSTAHIGLALRTLKTLDVKLRVGEERLASAVPTATADLNSLFSGLQGAMKLPKIEVPKIPELKVPEIPKLNAPKIPKLDAPKIPQIPDKLSQKPSWHKPNE